MFRMELQNRQLRNYAHVRPFVRVSWLCKDTFFVSGGLRCSGVNGEL
jgi:hypothetical protein